jgi:Zn-finger nucleic acid-binding protein
MSIGCPRCANSLVGRRIHDFVVHDCSECEGVFLDENAIGLLVEDPSPGRQRAKALLAELPQRPRRLRQGKRQPHVPCPLCKAMMNPRPFTTTPSVVVDVCRSHGTFFDAGELPILIKFVMRGGLEKSAKKTIERVPMRDGLAKYLAAAALKTPVSDDDSFDEGDALVGLLFELLA